MLLLLTSLIIFTELHTQVTKNSKVSSYVYKALGNAPSR